MTGTTPAALQALLAGDTENFLAASTPGGIEAQEKRGQTSFVNSAILPIPDDRRCTQAQLEAMGVQVGEKVDDLFVSVVLPQGWRKEATEHSMWSTLLDEQGRERATIFYKAAFYDRNAHMNLTRRYQAVGYNDCDAEGNLLERKQNGERAAYYLLRIEDCGKPIHTIGVHGVDDYPLMDRHDTEAREWLEANFPDHRNPLAYWA